MLTIFKPVRHWNIRTKLFAALSIVVLVSILRSLAVNYYAESFVATADMAVNEQELSGAIARLAQYGDSMTAITAVYADSGRPLTRGNYDIRLQKYRAVIDDLKNVPLSFEERAELENVLAAREPLFTIEQEAIVLVDAKKLDAAKTLLAGDGYQGYKKGYESFVIQTVDDISGKIKGFKSTGDHMLFLMRFWEVTLLLLLMVAGVGVLGAISLHITNAVRSIEEAAEAIGRGEIGKRIEVRGGDELGKLAIAFNKMAVALDEEVTGRLKEITKEVGQ